jgi:dihydrofolate synthase/folylpolyglutamate synthase
VGLEGAHQLENAALAWVLATKLHASGRFALPAPVRRTGLVNTSWPGRFDRREREGRAILFDVAHNAAGAQALAASLRGAYPGQKLPIVLGVLTDKDHGPILDALGPLSDPLWLTTPVEPERAFPAGELARVSTARGFRSRAIESPGEAALAALAAHAGATPVVITGSLFTVGPAMAALGFDPSAEPVGLRLRRDAASLVP